MSTNTRPSTRQLSSRIPPHTELQRQRIADNDPRRRLARNAIRSRRSNRSSRDRFRRRVDQHVHARGHVQVAELQRAGQRDDHGCIDIAQAALAICVFRSAFFELLFQRAGRERLCRYAAGQRRVVVNVEFQQVEERVVDEVDRAVDVLLYAKEELEGAAGLIASREWNIG
jgi:hypothetical protein